MVAGILSQALQQIQPTLRTNGFGISNPHRKIALFVPPSTKSPLFVYGKSPSQRSFLSLGSEEYDTHDSDYDASEEEGQLSRSVSLPSQVSEREPEFDWLLEEHQRMYSSVENSEDEEDEDDTHDQDYHGYQDETDDYTNLISRIRHNQLNFQRHSLRRNSYRSIGSLSLKVGEDFHGEKVTVQLEVNKLISYAMPLIVTFSLEQAFSLVNLMVVSHLGKTELGAVSLATMTSNIIFAIFDGLSSVLDTLCPQAYGAKHYETVGIHLQRCSILGMVLFIPFGLFWWFSDKILIQFVPDEEVVRLTGIYLRIFIMGAPAYILFENLKRYLQAQGIFEAGTYVLIICAPINVLLSYLLVWNEKIGVGFIGAPISASINFWLMLILLILYTVYIEGSKCWKGWNKKCLTHWKDLIKLSIPGIIMLEAESLSYEILTLFASRFGTNYLATQTAISTIGNIFYMISFSTGIASSTRIANFIGAKRITCAKLSTKVGILSSIVIGLLNCLIMIVFRYQLAGLFTNDELITDMIVKIFPLVGAASLFDSINSVSGCCLRGQGMQRVGGYINLFAYYFLGLPLAWYFGFYLDLKLNGLWYGMLISYIVIGIWQSIVVLDANWELILEEAEDRKEDHVNV